MGPHPRTARAQGRPPHRRPRSRQLTAAVALLTTATLGLGAALVARDPFAVGVAGVAAAASGWGALRLAWVALSRARLEHAVDRTELARSYRTLFAERAVENVAFVRSTAELLARRDRAVRDLEGSLQRVQLRAVEAETAARASQRALAHVEQQLAAMEALIGARQAEERAAAERRGAEQPAPRRGETVPEWADLEADPVDALLAWEAHAGEVAGRHVDEDRRRRRA